MRGNASGPTPGMGSATRPATRQKTGGKTTIRKAKASPSPVNAPIR